MNQNNKSHAQRVITEILAFAAAVGKSWTLGREDGNGKTLSAKEFTRQIKGMRERIAQLRRKVEAALPETTPEDFSRKLCLLTALTKANRLLLHMNVAAARQLFANFPVYVEKLQEQHEILQRATN